MIRLKVYLYPTRSPWCSPVLRSVNCTFGFQLNMEWHFGDGSDKLSLFEKAVIFATFFCCWGFVTTSFFWFIIPYFCLTVFVLRLQSAGCPNFFLSLLQRFWANGLFFLRCKDCLFHGGPTPSLDSEGVIRWENWRGCFAIYCKCVG